MRRNAAFRPTLSRGELRRNVWPCLHKSKDRNVAFFWHTQKLVSGTRRDVEPSFYICEFDQLLISWKTINSNLKKKRSLICAIKATVQYISSLYEELIKEQTAVFSGNVEVVVVVGGSPSALTVVIGMHTNTHQELQCGSECCGRPCANLQLG